MREIRLRYVGWRLTKDARGRAVAREVRKMRPVFNRIIKIVQLKHSGYSNVEIAKRHRISRERVRQELQFFKENFQLLN